MKTSACETDWVGRLLAPEAGVREKLFETAPALAPPQLVGERHGVPMVVGEFWTAKQRAAHSLHEISYRACFKPQLPAYFIQRFTAPGGRVLDPFMGRGTTLLEAAFHGRVPMGNDANPLSRWLLEPRLSPPTLQQIAARLEVLPLKPAPLEREDLLVFYHPDTLSEIETLRRHFLTSMPLAPIDAWIRMVATNRLTGHSPGFFSVYTMPPNQAVSIKSQIRINARRNQIPTYRDTRRLILKKSKQLLADGAPPPLKKRPTLLTGSADQLIGLTDGCVDLVVTSPPFLNVVQYDVDNWLRSWFCGVDADSVGLWMPKKLEVWLGLMRETFRELHRVVRPGGAVAFEVGEVCKGSIPLDEPLLFTAREAGLVPEVVMIHDQEFTKTSHCWGIDNNAGGTNTHRILLLRRPD